MGATRERSTKLQTTAVAIKRRHPSLKSCRKAYFYHRSVRAIAEKIAITHFINYKQTFPTFSSTDTT